jgi:hypothetical protein
VGAELFLNRLLETTHARKTLVTILARLSPYMKNKRDGIISDVIDKIIICMKRFHLEQTLCSDVICNYYVRFLRI